MDTRSAKQSEYIQKSIYERRRRRRIEKCAVKSVSMCYNQFDENWDDWDWSKINYYLLSLLLLIKMACLVQFSIVGTRRSAFRNSCQAFLTTTTGNWSLVLGTAFQYRTSWSLTDRSVSYTCAVSAVVNSLLLTISERHKTR